MPKRLNPMAVRSALTYDTEELARALGVSTATVSNMVKRGMPIMASQKPFLFSGVEVREFIKTERASNKSPMEPDELYCPSCRKGQKPAGGVITLASISSKTILLKGHCEACGCPSNRMASKAALPDFAAIYQISKADSS